MKCRGCGKHPRQKFEYCLAAAENGTSPEEYVACEEGTHNPRAKLFWFTSCYIKAGMPKGKA